MSKSTEELQTELASADIARTAKNILQCEPALAPHMAEPWFTYVLMDLLQLCPNFKYCPVVLAAYMYQAAQVPSHERGYVIVRAYEAHG